MYIVDVLGKICYEKDIDISDGKNIGRINTTHLYQGMYFTTIVNPKGRRWAGIFFR